eukprot:Seg752.6 transcript_id=Seg752.6/GoldUCD/mRNA.D3Y31 product="hypothetical protein" protein_id=Seg752.6/GoldUCD/D3Y31
MASQNSSTDLEAAKADKVFTNKHLSAQGQQLLKKDKEGDGDKKGDEHYVPSQDLESAKKKLRWRTIYLICVVFAALGGLVTVLVLQTVYKRQREQEIATLKGWLREKYAAQTPTTSTTETTRMGYPVIGKRQQLIQKPPSSTTFMGLTTTPKTKKLNCMELVADDGNRIINVTPGHALSHWHTLINRGDSTLEATMFIKIGDPGVYNVYGQVAFYRNNASTHLDFKIVRNHEVIAKAIADKCAHICTRYISRLVSLKKGDYLSIQSSYKVKLWMRKKLTYFGIRQIA